MIKVGEYEVKITVNDAVVWLPVTISLRGMENGITMYYLKFDERIEVLNCSKEDRILKEWLDSGKLVKIELIEPMKRFDKHKLK